MIQDEFKSIIKRVEGETIDFKVQGYDLKSKRYDFIKDILSMANTPRDIDALIVLGVRWTPEEGSTVIGLNRQYDDAEFQNALGIDRVQPRPRFTYVPFEFDGKKVGILQLPVEDYGPYTPINDYDSLQAGAVYHRRGTSNQRAIGTELRHIYEWFTKRNGTGRMSGADNAWQTFLDTVHDFSLERAFILVTDRIATEGIVPVQALGEVPWRAVIDFDPESDRTGLLKDIFDRLEKHRVIHRAVKGDYSISPEPGTHWFFARGLSGRQETLSKGNHKQWLQTYKLELGKQLEHIVRSISPTPISVIVLWSDNSLRAYLRTVIEEIHGVFSDLAEIVVVSEDTASFGGICEEAGVTFVQMGLRSLCAGIDVQFSEVQEHDAKKCILPNAANGPTRIESKDRLWLSEDLELVYLGIGISGEDPAEAFRRGGQISWRNLQLRHDCDRDISLSVRTRVQAELQDRGTIRINLYHAPGAGGSTVGHRVVWDLHESWPSAILHRCDPRVTAERIAKIYSLTEKSVLVLVDGGEHSERNIDDLYEYLKASQTPTVLLQVLRRFKPQKIGKREFYLDAELSDGEVDRFYDVYTKAVPGKASELGRLSSKENKSQWNAFFFGLTAYGHDFRGLSPYVETRLSRLTADQQKILVYIAIAHYYGQQSVPVQAFAQLVGLSHSHAVELRRFFQENEPALELIVKSQKGEWRTIHHFVALEILQQILSPARSKERATVWRQNLSNWAKEFASFCRRDDHAMSDRLLELVRRVFIYRDNIELLGTERALQKQFSQLIEDVPSRNGQIEVLRYLTTEFPFEAHFHAHLGRSLGLNGDFKEAFECVAHAISIQPEDHVLHHVRGMIFRYAIKDKIKESAPIAEVIDLAKKASENFEQSRSLHQDQEYSYISEIQMLIDMLDYAGKSSNMKVHDIISKSDSDPFLKQALDQVEGLLDRVRYLYVGEQPSEYIIDCQAKLQRIYGDFAKTLQAYDSLLAYPEIAKPPIRRQIVWTILRRQEGLWNKLNDKDIKRVTDLLEDNLREESKDSVSLRLWLRAIRYSKYAPSLDSIIERVAYWKANTNSLDAIYYLYVLHMLRALNGSSQALADAERMLEECKTIARFRRDRTRSFEWIGNGYGIQKLVHQSLLGEWKDDFWESANLLSRIEGRIASIDGPQKGIIEIPGGLKAFFVPAKGDFQLEQDVNCLVTCYLGFSYDGPRAWSVMRKG